MPCCLRGAKPLPEQMPKYRQTGANFSKIWLQSKNFIMKKCISNCRLKIDKILSRDECSVSPQFNDLGATGSMLGKFINYQQDCQDKLTGHLFVQCEKDVRDQSMTE